MKPLCLTVGTQRSHKLCFKEGSVRISLGSHVSLPSQSHWTSYLILCHGNLVGFLEVKPMKLWGPSKTAAPILVHTQSQAVPQNYCLSIPASYSSSGSCCRWADLGHDPLNSSLRVAVWPPASVLCWIPDQTLIFSLLSFFLGSDNFQTLYLVELKPEVNTWAIHIQTNKDTVWFCFSSSTNRLHRC